MKLLKVVSFIFLSLTAFGQPVNDNPCGAITLPVNAGGCTFQTHVLPTTTTNTGGVPAPGCGSMGPDIWFQVTVPASGALIIDLSSNGGPTDMCMAWYTGPNCGNLNTLIECDDDDSQNGLMPMICHAGSGCTIPGDCQQNSTLTPGMTVWVRIWEYGGGTFGGFDICAYEPPPSTGPSTCATATNIPSLPFTGSGTTCCSTNNYGQAVGCGGSYQTGEDYLYQYTPSVNQVVDINLTGTLSYTGLHVTADCPGWGTCVGQATATGGNPSLCGINMTAGTTYYIMIDTWPSPPCTPFNISITESSAPTCNLNYSFSSIPYSPDPNAGTSIPMSIDDRFSSYIPIGFDFCFDGTPYTQFLVSSNGYLIFDPVGCSTNLPTTNASPGAYSGWPINTTIPNTTEAPRNAIMFPWQDIDPSVGGTLRYQVLGVAPNRRLVVTFFNVPYFSCNNLLFTGQVKLFETTNNIEIHLGNKTICSTWNGGNGILGLHNYNGTQAVLGIQSGITGGSDWTASNQAARFTYNCGLCPNPLPVGLSSFDGHPEEGYNILEWNTESEQNNAYFILESASDGVNFEELAYITGAGTTTEKQNYSHRHENPEELVYYRLKQVDYDGEYEYSNIIAVSSRIENDINFFPNPAENALFFNLNEELEGTYIVEYTDVLGNTIRDEVTFNKMNLSYEAKAFKGLSSGVYIISILDQDGQALTVQKVIKK